MLGACSAAAKVVMNSDAEIAEGLRDATGAMDNAPRTDNHLEQLEALRTLVDEIEKQKDFTKLGEICGMITLVKTTWSYLYRDYFSIRRGADV